MLSMSSLLPFCQNNGPRVTILGAAFSLWSPHHRIWQSFTCLRKNGQPARFARRPGCPAGGERVSLALSAGKCIPFALLFLLSRSPQTINDKGKSGAEADVRVRVRAGVVAVEVEHASVRTVVPVAPAIHAAPLLFRHIPHGYALRLFPAAEQTPDFVQFFAPDFMEPRRN